MLCNMQNPISTAVHPYIHIQPHNNISQDSILNWYNQSYSSSCYIILLQVHFRASNTCISIQQLLLSQVSWKRRHRKLLLSSSEEPNCVWNPLHNTFWSREERGGGSSKPGGPGRLLGSFSIAWREFIHKVGLPAAVLLTSYILAFTTAGGLYRYYM